MFAVLSSVAFRVWNALIFILVQIAAVVVFVLNLVMFPQPRTRQPNKLAVSFWLAINIGMVAWLALTIEVQNQLYPAAVSAAAHFLIVVTALLVITEENDVWDGYVRFDRIGGKDERVFKRGGVAKSLPVIGLSAILYLLYSAIVVRALNWRYGFLTAPFTTQISLSDYFATVASQIPVVDTILKSTNLKPPIEFQGSLGMTIKSILYISNVSIIVGTFNSYFRQKRQIRRLVEGLGSNRGNIPVLQAHASRAPEEIKAAILKMSLTDPEARIRWRAATVALYANIVTFPTTIVYNLHKERKERNKLHFLTIAIQIVKNNYDNLDADYLEALARKIEFQLESQQRRHSRKTLNALIQLRQYSRPTAWARAA